VGAIRSSRAGITLACEERRGLALRRVWAVLGLGAILAAAGGGVWSWIRGRDEPYDDEREIWKYAANPPREITVPADVTLVLVERAEAPDPTLLDVSLGKTSLREHGRVALAVPADAAVGFGEVQPKDLRLSGLEPMVLWGRKLNAAVDADPLHVGSIGGDGSPFRRAHADRPGSGGPHGVELGRGSLPLI
jgi:hypothetical protein